MRGCYGMVTARADNSKDHPIERFERRNRVGGGVKRKLLLCNFDVSLVSNRVVIWQGELRRIGRSRIRPTRLKRVGYVYARVRNQTAVISTSKKSDIPAM